MNFKRAGANLREHMIWGTRNCSDFSLRQADEMQPIASDALIFTSQRNDKYGIALKIHFAPDTFQGEDHAEGDQIMKDVYMHHG